MKRLLDTRWHTRCPISSNTQWRCRSITTNSRYANISEEVQQAVAEKLPVVALESTIYTHGFPYPQNMVLATNLESIVRSAGAVPATIGILDGVARIGLDGDDLIRLASSSQEPDSLLKVSRRDLAFALSAKTTDDRSYTGGTTVAGTMVLAHLAGIKIFATGGLGGVHRGVSETLDISADLTELGRTPLAVIAAGSKAFLDIPKTLEYLETQGVAVATLADGRAGDVDFPGFWSRDSGFKAPMTIKDELAAAQMIVAQTSLGLQSGILFGNPVPAEYEIPYQGIQSAIDEALREASSQGITGNRATPFILAKIKELTGSKSVAANTALVENNVRVGARIAMEVSFLERYHSSRQPAPRIEAGARSISASSVAVPKRISELRDNADLTKSTAPTQERRIKTKVFVAGMLAVDFACDYRQRKDSDQHALKLYTSNPARITQSLGGVGHNVARAVELSGVETRLLSAVGSDINGAAAMKALQLEHMDVSGIATLPESSGRRTAQYVAVNDDKKDLVVAMADMTILEYDSHAAKHVDDIFKTLWLPDLRQNSPSYLVIDANWSSEYLAQWIDAARQSSTKVVFEPVSTAKAAGIFHTSIGSGQPRQQLLSVFPNPSVHLATPNEHELLSMYDAAKTRGYFDRQEWWQVVDAFGIPSSGARAKLALATSSDLVDRGIPQQSLQLLPYIPCITTKLGAQGVLVTQIIPANDLRLHSPEHAPHMLAYCTNGSEKDTDVGGVYMRLFPPAEVVDPGDVVSVNGIGDTFAGVLVAGLAKRAKNGQPETVEDLIDIAQRASVLTLKSSEAVSPELSTLSSLI